MRPSSIKKKSWDELNQVIKEKRFQDLGRDEKGSEVYDKASAEIKKDWVTVGDMILNREFGINWAEKELEDEEKVKEESLLNQAESNSIEIPIEDESNNQVDHQKTGQNEIHIETSHNADIQITTPSGQETSANKKKSKRKYIPSSDKSLICKEKKDVYYSPTGRVYTLKKNDFPYYLDEDIEHHLLWSLEEPSQQEVDEILEKHLTPEEFDKVWFENPPSLKTVPNAWHAHVFSKKKPKK